MARFRTTYGRRKKTYKRTYKKGYGKSSKKLYYNKSKAYPSGKFVKLVAKALKKSPAESKDEFKAKNMKLFNTRGGFFAWKPNRKALALVDQPGSPWQHAASTGPAYGPYGPEGYADYDEEEYEMQ